MVKRLPAMWETQVRSLGWEDPLERKWQPTPVPLPGKSHGQRSLVCYSSWDRKESDMTERLKIIHVNIKSHDTSALYNVLFFHESSKPFLQLVVLLIRGLYVLCIFSL